MLRIVGIINAPYGVYAACCPYKNYERGRGVPSIGWELNLRVIRLLRPQFRVREHGIGQYPLQFFRIFRITRNNAP